MKRKTVILVVLAVLVAVGGWAFFAGDGKKIDKSLPAQNREVLKVQDKRLARGDDTAPVKIVEYADVLCPYCAKANDKVIPQIASNYIVPKKAHYEMRLIAMTSPDSQRAGEGAYCAAEQGKFWDYMNTAYRQTWDNYYSLDKGPEDVDIFSQGNIYGFAKGLGLNMWEWQQCMDTGKYKETLIANKNKMSELEAYGTPHFVINGSNYNGAPPFAAFKAVIDVELRKLEYAS